MDESLTDSSGHDVPFAKIAALLDDHLDVSHDSSNTGLWIGQAQRNVLQRWPLFAVRFGRHQTITYDPLSEGVDQLLTHFATWSRKLIPNGEHSDIFLRLDRGRNLIGYIGKACWDRSYRSQNGHHQN